jgi:hypothetical protein
MTRQLTPYTIGGDTVVCWCDIDQVSLMTGKTVTVATMIQAQGLVELYAEAFADNPPPDMFARDLKYLQDMLAYQAAWMSGRLDTFDNVDVTNASQDGQSATVAHEQANKLAPLAWLACKRLSWNRTGRVRVDYTRRRRFANWQEVQDAFLRDQYNPPLWQTGA